MAIKRNKSGAVSTRGRDAVMSPGVFVLHVTNSLSDSRFSVIMATNAVDTQSSEH